MHRREKNVIWTKIAFVSTSPPELTSEESVKKQDGARMI